MAPTNGTPVDEQVEVESQSADENTVEGTSTAVAEVAPRPKPRPKKSLSRIDRTVMEFQPDVVELEHRKVPGGARWTLYVTILMIIAAVAWSWWAEVDRIVIAQGELIPSEKPILIQPLESAKILRLHAEFNQIVKAGDLLVTLDPTYSDADVSRLTKQQFGLEARKARLEAELQEVDFDITGHSDSIDWILERKTFNERKRQYEAELKRLDAERQKILTEQEANEKNIEAREKVVKILEKRVQTEKELAESGAAPVRDYENVLFQYENASLEYKLALNRRGEFQESLNVNAKEKEKYIAQTRAEISELLVQTQQQLNSVTEELNKALHSRSQAELRVPTSYGDDAQFRVLQQAELSVGSVATPNDAIYRLMPLNAKLEVEIKIDGKDVARLRADRVENPLKESDEGDVVRIKLASFPYQKHGTLEGRVRAISEGTFAEGQGPMQRMMYRGRVRLVTTQLEEVPDDFRLVPGMACTAEIKIGKRKVIEYFLYPLFRYLDSSIREP